MGGSLGGVMKEECDVSRPFAKMEKEYQALFLRGGKKPQTNTNPTPKQTSRRLIFENF